MSKVSRDAWCGLNLDAWAKGILRNEESQLDAKANVVGPNGTVSISLRPIAEAVRREVLAGALEALAEWVRR